MKFKKVGTLYLTDEDNLSGLLNHQIALSVFMPSYTLISRSIHYNLSFNSAVWIDLYVIYENCIVVFCCCCCYWHVNGTNPLFAGCVHFLYLTCHIAGHSTFCSFLFQFGTSLTAICLKEIIGCLLSLTVTQTYFRKDMRSCLQNLIGKFCFGQLKGVRQNAFMETVSFACFLTLPTPEPSATMSFWLRVFSQEY